MMRIFDLSRYCREACARWWLGRLRPITDTLVGRISKHLRIYRRIWMIDQRLGLLEQVVSTWTVSSWVEQATLERTPLVSVILPTRNRSDLLRRAIGSVCAQVYNHWEIILVDDGSEDDTPVVMAELRQRLGDNHLQAFRIQPSGVSAARNRGLARARGELIAYLDDDNAMHPLWLKAVVWALSQRPEVDVVYGGIIVDDIQRMRGGSDGDLPSYYLHSFDRQRLVKNNLADIGQVAHRNGLREARFDESLQALGDWDLLLRLTRDKPPLVIPVLACFYSTQAPDRLSAGGTFDSEIDRVRKKARS